jgi:tetratricopeptide (TPR) repeat protein
MTRLSKPLFGAVFACLLLMCVAQATPSSTPEHATLAVPIEDRLPDIELTPQILFSALAAEIALQRAQPGTAYQTYLALARETHDPRIAKRTVEIAISAHSSEKALTAARLWRQFAPTAKKAAQTEALLLLLNGKLDEAQPILAAELAQTSGAEHDAAIAALQARIASTLPAARGLRLLQTLLKNETAGLEAQLALARQKILANDIDGAHKQLQRYLSTVEKQPKTQPAANIGRILFALAQIAAEKKQDALALQYLEKIEPGSMHYISALFARVEYLAKLNKINDARALLASLKNSSSSGDRGPSTALKKLIVRTDSALLGQAQRYQEAENQLGLASQNWPDDPNLLYDYAMMAEKNRHFTLMETVLHRVIILRPDHPAAYNALGFSLADRNLRLDEANAFIEKAAALAPDAGYIIDSLGWVKYRRGEISQAITLLQRAYKIQPDIEIGAHLGEVLWIGGAQEEAQQVWQKIRQQAPENHILQETLKRFLPDS